MCGASKLRNWFIFRKIGRLSQTRVKMITGSADWECGTLYSCTVQDLLILASAALHALPCFAVNFKRL